MMHSLRKVLPILAIAAVFYGVVVATRSLREIAQARGHIEDKVERLAELQRIRDGKAASPAALNTLETLSDQEPPQLEVMCEALLDDIPYQYESEGLISAGSAWLVLRNKISFENIALSKLGHFIGALESERPPWRVRACSIEAGATPGSARVILNLEALYKEDI